MGQSGDPAGAGPDVSDGEGTARGAEEARLSGKGQRTGERRVWGKTIRTVDTAVR